MKTTAGRQARIRPDQAAASSAIVGSSDKRSEPWRQIRPPLTRSRLGGPALQPRTAKDRLTGRVRFAVHAKLPKWLESLNMFRTAVGKEIMSFGVAREGGALGIRGNLPLATHLRYGQIGYTIAVG
jgi:hypothetical protein